MLGFQGVDLFLCIRHAIAVVPADGENTRVDFETLLGKYIDGPE